MAILLVAAGTAAAFLALNRPRAQASPGATITVSSTGDTDARDDFITLREAMPLATGTLAVGDLNSSECLLVFNALSRDGGGHHTVAAPSSAQTKTCASAEPRFDATGD